MPKQFIRTEGYKFNYCFLFDIINFIMLTSYWKIKGETNQNGIVRDRQVD